MTDCDCSDEYGPCEQHCETLVVREGASTRTADELLSVFVHDAVSLGVTLSPWGQDVLMRYDTALDNNRHMGVAWLPDGSGLDDMMDTLRYQVEAELSAMGLMSYFEDGYIIVRPTPDCPLLEE